MATAENLQKDLRVCANREKAAVLSRFFKTGPGQYGAGDRFIGVIVPDQRRLAKKYRDLDLLELQKLLASPIHEERLAALLILVDQYKRAATDAQGKIFRFYLKNTKRINNWDLVDLSAPNIVGAWLYGKNKTLLYRLAKSKNLWERRIAVLATFYFIRRGDSTEILKLARLLLSDREDLIQKAVGWMLREAGKNINEKILTDFLDNQATRMPRTMLRYAIERLPPRRRKKYLAIKPLKK